MPAYLGETEFAGIREARIGVLGERSREEMVVGRSADGRPAGEPLPMKFDRNR